MDLQPKLSAQAITELRDRWATPEGLETQRKLIKSLRDQALDWKDAYVAPATPSVPASYPGLMTDLRGLELSDLDLTNLQLPYVDLSYASFRRCVLEDTCLQGSMLRWAGFQDCNMNRCDLLQVMADHSSFKQCSMHEAVLGNGDFRAASFLDVQLPNAILDGADITDASLRKVVLKDAHMLFTKFPKGFNPENPSRRPQSPGIDPEP